MFLGKDSCSGDSGGPLIFQDNPNDPMFVVGIVSFGTDPCGEGFPGVYTDTRKYSQWIRSKLRP